jgi:Na+/melibiose symporter-like transporter
MGLSAWRMLAYGGLALPLATIGLPISIYLAPFFAGELGLPLAAIGTAMIAARMVDLILDPAIGFLSDRWRPAFGRRRIWLPIGGLSLGAGVLMLFNPVPPVGILYFLGWVTVVYVGFTAVKLPYDALGAELSDEYRTRTRITATRQMFTLAGLVLSTLIPAWVLSQPGATSADVLAALSKLMLVLLPLGVLLIALFVPEPPVDPASREVPLLTGLRSLRGNGPFVRIAAALFLGYVAETFRITITLFFARDVIGVPNLGLIYVWYFLTGLAGVPAWTWLAGRLGKHRALALAFGIVIATNTGIFFLGAGDVALFTALFMAKGFCFGALELLPAAMVADTSDIDTVKTGERRAGLLFAVLGLVIKLAQAIGAGLSLNLLSLVDYRASGETSEPALLALRLLYTLFPTLLLAPALLLVWRYPLTAGRHARIRDYLDRRSARAQCHRAPPGSS